MAPSFDRARSEPDPGALRPWSPAVLAPGEAAARERLARRFPAGPGGVALSLFGRALGEEGLRLVLDGMARDPIGFAAPERAVVLALAVGPDAAAFRLALGMEGRLACAFVDRVLGRVAGSTRARLSSGERGALLFAVDQLGGDWLAAGGGAFCVKGFLVDWEQVGEYLGRAPAWEVAFRLDGDRLAGSLALWLASPPPVREGCHVPAADWAVAAAWPVRLGIEVGHARLPAEGVADLAAGDLVVLDAACHPDRALGGCLAALRSGRFRRAIRWVDRRCLEVAPESERTCEVEDEGRDERMIDAALLEPRASDAADLEVVVRVEAGEVSMTVEDAARLVPGRVIRLDRAVGGDVFLKVGEKRIGRGRLVEADGELAVEVLEVP